MYHPPHAIARAGAASADPAARPSTAPPVPEPPSRTLSDWPRLAARALNAEAALLLARSGGGAWERLHGPAVLLQPLRPQLEQAIARAEPLAAVGTLSAPVIDASGAVLGALGVVMTARTWTQADLAVLRELAAGSAAELAAQHALTALRDSEERFRAMFEGAAIGVLVVDMQGRIVESNAAYRRLVRLGERELHGLPFWSLNHPDDAAADLSLFRDLAAGRRSAYREEMRYRLPDGGVIWVNLATSVVRDARGTPRFCVAMVENVTERKAMEARLRHDALHDALTDLPNRTLFRQRLDESAASGRPFAVYFLDLDRFKLITDSLGHLAGDELLRVVAGRLRGCLGPADTVARFGGDEFVLLLDGVSGADEAGRRAEQIQSALTAPVSLRGYEMFTSASIGIALSSDVDETASPEHLLRNADAAMYRARALGAERHAVFDRSMHQEALHRLQLETDLRQALRRDEFRLVYQPIVELASDRIAGWEVLVRWHHPERGVVPPLEFIGIAEDTGLIVPLGRWVLREACRQVAEWQAMEAGGEPRFVCVNLSARQFVDATLYDEVRDAVRESGLRPGSLKLELTESTLMNDPGSAVPLLLKLRALGIPIYLDDFGTGYSSLAYLHQLPLDGLKIDRSFVQRADGTAVVQTIVALARSLGVAVVAEGIEEAHQAAALRAMGCRYGQGYFFSRPLDPHTVPASLALRPAAAS